MTKENSGNYSKVRKLLFNEVSLFISIVAAVFSIYFFLTGPQEINKKDIIEIKHGIEVLQLEIDSIKNNHLSHLQSALEVECTKNEEQDETLKQIEINIARILVILEKE